MAHQVTRFETLDGALHASPLDAKRHAEKRYGDALTAISHKLARLEKYAAIQDFIDANLGEFTALAELREDCEMSPETDEG